LQLRKGQVAHADVRQRKEVLEVDLRIGVPSRPLPCVKEGLDNRVQQDGSRAPHKNVLHCFDFPPGGDLQRQLLVSGLGATGKRVALDNFAPVPDSVAFR
jgi:hypothetical protein